MFGSKKNAQVDVTVIGSEAVIEGKISGSGRFQVDGKVEGTLLVQGEVSIGPQGAVLGELSTDELSVGGRVQGKIHVRGHLRVLSGGSVSGEVRYTTLEIERGGVLEGHATNREQEEPAKESGAVVVSIRPEPMPARAAGTEATTAAKAVAPPPLKAAVNKAAG